MCLIRSLIAVALLTQFAFADIGWLQRKGEKRTSLQAAIPVWDSKKSLLNLYLYDRETSDEDGRFLALTAPQAALYRKSAPLMVISMPLNLNARGRSRFTGNAMVHYRYGQGSGSFVLGSFKMEKDKPLFTLIGLRNLAPFQPVERSIVELHWVLKDSIQGDYDWSFRVHAPLLLYQGK